jgi:hypothetical protein
LKRSGLLGNDRRTKAASSSTLLAILILVAACTYGPEEQRVTIGQIIRVGESPQALVAIQYERFQSPTGLSAFPDGGKSRVHERLARLYLLDVIERTALLLTAQTAPDSLWESFSAGVVGLEGDSVAYLRMTGCPREGECHPQLQVTVTLHVTTGGEVRVVPEAPANSSLPGRMLARRPGEDQYVRFSTEGNVVTARFVEDAPFQPVFEVRNDGSMSGIGG